MARFALVILFLLGAMVTHAQTAKAVKLKDLQKIIESKEGIQVINFWATWCGPCRAENPNVVKVITDRTGLAMAFSRAPLPWWRDRGGVPPKSNANATLIGRRVVGESDLRQGEVGRQGAGVVAEAQRLPGEGARRAIAWRTFGSVNGSLSWWNMIAMVQEPAYTTCWAFSSGSASMAAKSSPPEAITSNSLFL